MRTIKFRALKDDISNCNWVYGNLIYDADGNPRIQEKNGDTYFTTCLKGTECQYTGLKDKNGTEIYEGDIMRFTHPSKDYAILSNIIYSEQSGRYHANGTTCDNLFDFITDVNGKNCSEVIGNIYENPDLI